MIEKLGGLWGPVGVATETGQILFRLVLVAAIGFIIGLERERYKKEDELFAGMRTFSLISLAGYLSYFIAHFTSIWVFIGTFLGLGIFFAISYYISAAKGDPGATSEIAALLTFLIGALVSMGYLHLSITAAVVILLLLSLKFGLQKFLGKIQDQDIFAIIQFVIISAIILPLLPDRDFGPFLAINMREIWFFIVLIASINFIGYVLMRAFGGRKGVFFTAVVGGLFSSTAVALSFSQRSREHKQLARSYAAGIILSSSIMFARIMFLTYVINAPLFSKFYVPHLLLLTVGIIAGGFLLSHQPHQVDRMELTYENPLKLLSAIKFGIFYVVIVMLIKTAEHYLGDHGIFLASFISGLADVDPLTISMAKLGGTSVAINTAVVAILIAALSNTLVKYGFTVFLGGPGLKKYTTMGFGAMLITAIAYIIAIY